MNIINTLFFFVAESLKFTHSDVKVYNTHFPISISEKSQLYSSSLIACPPQSQPHFLHLPASASPVPPFASFSRIILHVKWGDAAHVWVSLDYFTEQNDLQSQT